MYFKTTEIVTASSIAASSCYSQYYLNGRLLEIGIAKHSSLPITTAPFIKLYRETSAANNFIMKTHCPTSQVWFKPRFAMVSTSTAGAQTAVSTNLITKEPMVFANERILIKIGETSKAAYTKFQLATRTDGFPTPVA